MIWTAAWSAMIHLTKWFLCSKTKVNNTLKLAFLPSIHFISVTIIPHSNIQYTRSCFINSINISYFQPMWALWNKMIGTYCAFCFSKISFIAYTLANEDGIISQQTVQFKYPSLDQNLLSKSCLISYLYNIFKHIGLFHSCIKVDMDNCVVCNMQMKFLAEREKS